MKIIIAHSETKREINGPLNICGSKEDLVSFAKQILSKADKDEFCYGWIEIVERKQKDIVNTPPKGWDE